MVFIVWYILKEKIYQFWWNPTYLVFFVVVSCACTAISKKSLWNPVSWRFSPKCSSKLFIVLVLVFRNLIYFEVIFVYVWGRSPSSFFHMCLTSFPSIICWKSLTFFLHWIFCHSLETVVKSPPAMQENWVGRSSGEGKGYPLQYSGLENSMDCLVDTTTQSRVGHDWVTFTSPRKSTDFNWEGLLLTLNFHPLIFVCC